MKAPAFQFYAQDFLTGCTYLTNEEIGMYIKMLCKQWTDGNIPKKRLGFLVGIDWDNFSDELKSKFIDNGDFILNKRLETEREKSINFRSKQAENGKKGGRPKKEKESETVDIPDVKPKPFKKQKPNKSQKKPLEKEDRSMKIEYEEVIEKRKEGSGEKQNLLMPDEFKPLWEEWLEYRTAKKKKPYAGGKWEQMAVNKLIQLSNNNSETAILILRQTIENNWEGFFELKNIQNGTKQGIGSKGIQYSEEFKRKIADGLQS